MRLVLGISTVLGVIGVVAAFGLFYLGERVFHLDRAHIQSLMYLKLSVAGHADMAPMNSKTPEGRPGSVGTDTSGRELSSLELTELRARLQAPSDGSDRWPTPQVETAFLPRASNGSRLGSTSGSIKCC